MCSVTVPDYTTSINTINFTFTQFSNNASYSYDMGIEPGGTEVAELYVSRVASFQQPYALALVLVMCRQ